MADQRDPTGNPFVGPRALESGEPIFGREVETRKLANLLLANRIVLLYSPSGAGKTSLIQAALAPRLRERNFDVRPGIRLNLIPPAEVASLPGFNPYVFSALTSLEEGRAKKERLQGDAASQEEQRPKDEPISHQALAQMSINDYLAQQGGNRLFLIFDQFEEVLTIYPLDRERKMAFFEQLGEALSQSNRWALFAIREDYLGGLAPYTLPIPNRFKDTFRLDLLETEAARQVVQSTAALGNVLFTDEAAARLMDDLTRVRVQLPDGSFETQPGLYVEPVHLQVVCRDLWEKRDPNDPDITADEIEKIGDVDDALASYYDNQVASLATQERLSEWKVRNWCGTRLITESDIRSQVLMGQEESGGLANTAINRLVDAHLVRREPRRGGIWFELAHDRLIVPIRRSNTRWSAEHLSPWRRQAALWEAERRPDRLLLAGELLDEAVEWASDNAGQLSEEEVEFLESSKRRHQALQLDAERRKAQAQRRFLILVSLALLVAIGLGVYSALQTVRVTSQARALETANQVSRNDAIRLQTLEAQAQGEKGTAQAERGTADALRVGAQKNEQLQLTIAAGMHNLANNNATLAVKQFEMAQTAFARQLAIQGESLLDSQPGLAGLLAAESYTITPTWESRGLLLDLAQLGVDQQVQPYGFPIPEPESLILVMALSPDGERLAWGTRQGYVAIWNYQKGAIEWNKRLHTRNVISLAFSPDGKWLASGAYLPQLYITDVASGEQVADLSNAVNNNVLIQSFNPDQTMLAAAILHRILIWRTGDPWEKVIEFPAEPGWIQELAWSPDGKLLASGEAKAPTSPNLRLVVWDPLTEGQKLQVDFERTITGLDWSPDGKTLVVGSISGQIRRWDMTTGREISEPGIPTSNEIYGVAYSKDGKILAAGGLDPAITLYNTRDFSVFQRIPNADDEFVNDLMFAPRKGANLLATLYENWRTGRRRIALSVVTPQNPLSQEVAIADARILGIGGSLETGLRQMTSTVNGILVEELPVGGQNAPQPIFEQSGVFNASAISPAGDNLALWGQDGTVTLYKLPSGEVSGTFSLGTRFGQSLAFSPDGGRLAVGLCAEFNIESGVSNCTQGEIQLWDTRSGQRLDGTPLLGQRDFITALTFSADGTRLASGSRDRTIQIWDLTSLTPDGLPLERHAAPISGLAFSQDGLTLASGSQDGSLILWDLDSRLPVGSPLVGGRADVSVLAFDPGGSLLAGYGGGSLLEWLVFPDNLLEIACSKAERPFTPGELAQYFPQGGYQNKCGK